MTEPETLQAQLDNQRQRVDVDNYIITLRELLSMAERQELRRAPEYQRKFRWDEEAESRLIESLLLGLPVPNLFFATNTDGTWEVVDGLQRISTAIHFCSDSQEQLDEIGKGSNLRLSGLKKLTAVNNLTFRDLPTPVQLTLKRRGLGVTSLSDKSDPQARFETFERLNSGAVALSPQEVRACIYDGPLNVKVREIAADADFQRLVKLQERDQDTATHEELVLKFFAYLNDRDRFSDAVKEFLNNYMEAQRNEDFFEDGELLRQVVSNLLELTEGPFLRSNTNVTPQNELEAVMVGGAEVLRERGSWHKPTEGWLDDPELVRASTGATNTRAKLRGRIGRAKQLLQPA